jgi:hypothetical protein
MSRGFGNFGGLGESIFSQGLSGLSGFGGFSSFSSSSFGSGNMPGKSTQTVTKTMYLNNNIEMAKQ